MHGFSPGTFGSTPAHIVHDINNIYLSYIGAHFHDFDEGPGFIWALTQIDPPSSIAKRQSFGHRHFVKLANSDKDIAFQALERMIRLGPKGPDDDVQSPSIDWGHHESARRDTAQ